MSATGLAMPASPAAPIPLLLIRVAGQPLALRQREIAEILPLPRLTPLPAAPPIVLGCFLLGEVTVFVLPMSSLLGLSGPAEGTALYHHLLLLPARQGAPQMALRVDRVTEMVQAEPLPLSGQESFNGCVEAEIHLDEGVVPLISVSRLLTAYERERLLAFTALENSRAAVFRPAEPR